MPVPQYSRKKINVALSVRVKVNNISSQVYWNFTQLFKSLVRGREGQIF